MKYILRWLIKAYQILHVPFFRNVCRFEPTCSHYALEALEKHGVIKGSWLSVKRVARCNPFSKGGWDPVPCSHHTKQRIEK